jgi:hypothetical protein
VTVEQIVTLLAAVTALTLAVVKLISSLNDLSKQLAAHRAEIRDLKAAVDVVANGGQQNAPPAGPLPQVEH